MIKLDLLPSVLRVLSYEGGQLRDSGTAWHLGEGYWLTAAHCIGDYDLRRRYTGPIRIQVGSGGETADAVVVGHDWDFDVAVLRMNSSHPAISTCGLPAADAFPDGISWYSYGFPTAHEEGMHVDGHVTSPQGKVGGRRAIQLTCAQGGHGALGGLSGAPVCVGGAAVAVIRYGPPDLQQSVIMATAMEDIFRLFPSLKGGKDAGASALPPAAAPSWTTPLSGGNLSSHGAAPPSSGGNMSSAAPVTEGEPGAMDHRESPEVMPRKVRLLISYDKKKDDTLVKQLVTHLAPLVDLGLIEVQANRPLLAHHKYTGVVDPGVEKADIVVLLVTPSFFENSYCYGGEMVRALKLQEEDRLRVIPVIGRPCELTDAPFASLPGFPSDGVPVTEWPDRDAAWTDVVEGIWKVAEVWRSRPPRADRPAVDPQNARRAVPPAPAAPPAPAVAPAPAEAVPVTASSLRRQLVDLLPTAFNQVVFELGIRPGMLLPATTPQNDRAIELIRHCEGLGESGLARLAAAILQVRSEM